MARILVIEDEYLLREQITSMLELAGFDVCGAPNGMQGTELAKTQSPDLIVCDINMPHMNGYEVLHQVRQNPATNLVPFLFLTARVDSESLRHGMELGADDYVTKPFRYGELVRAVQTRLTRYYAFLESTRSEVARTKSNLIHLVAHELRSPLISISMVKEIISRHGRGMGRDELNELLDTFTASTDHMSHLVEQMVYLTQLESGAMEAKSLSDWGLPLEAWQLVVGAITSARRFSYNHAQLEINLHEEDRGTVVLGDIRALKHAIAEVIANALNFSPEGTNVAVAYRAAHDMLEITITDHGSGMTLEQQKLALRDFEQVNRDIQEQQGMGLGLYVARQIIAAHSGEFRLMSAPGRGTQVYIKLPIVVVQ
ncbi:MAG: response regulator [Anaerolineae bacterium]